MKVLTMNVCFLLPDDFEGGLNDALSEIISYRRTKGYKNIPDKAENPRGDLPPIDDAIWADFLDAAQEGKRLYGGLFIGTFKDGEWVHAREEVNDGA